MMRLSKLADYSVVILSALAIRPESLHAAQKLAEYTRLPVPTVAKVLKKMARAHIVAALRGATGGYRLARPAADITLAHIIEAIDGPIKIVSCIGANSEPCGREDVCPIYGRWDPLNAAIQKAFSSVSLEALVLSEQAAMEAMLGTVESAAACAPNGCGSSACGSRACS